MISRQPCSEEALFRNSSAFPLIMSDLSPNPSSETAHLIVLDLDSSGSTKTAFCAPLESASRPTVPVPAYKSAKLAPAILFLMISKKASLTLEEVGLSLSPDDVVVRSFLGAVLLPFTVPPEILICLYITTRYTVPQQLRRLLCARRRHLTENNKTVIIKVNPDHKGKTWLMNILLIL